MSSPTIAPRTACPCSRAKARAIDESKVDKQGRFVLVDFASGDLELWDLRTGKTELFAWGNPDDKPGGHTDLGATFMVNGDGWNTGLPVRRDEAMHGAANLTNIVTYRRPDGSLNWSISDHASLRTDDETFVIGSTYGGDGSYAAFQDEIYLARTDGSGFVRLAQTRGVPRLSSAFFNLKIPASLWPRASEPTLDATAPPPAACGRPTGPAAATPRQSDDEGAPSTSWDRAGNHGVASFCRPETSTKHKASRIRKMVRIFMGWAETVADYTVGTLIVLVQLAVIGRSESRVPIRRDRTAA
jgi:hypothetical protein